MNTSDLIDKMFLDGEIDAKKWKELKVSTMVDKRKKNKPKRKV